MESYTTIKKEGKFEYEDRKSVFIGYSVPVSHEQDALDFISFIKKKHPDARHHVYAYVLRENSIMRFSDDREPQGTAGMPVLDAIRKRGCTDTAVVVVRYFGGTLLGTGGLVRAYSSAAAGALLDAEIITYDIYTLVDFHLGYSDYQKAVPLLTSNLYRTDDTIYADSVIIKGRILKSNFEKLVKEITEITSGRVKIDKKEEIFDF